MPKIPDPKNTNNVSCVEGIKFFNFRKKIEKSVSENFQFLGVIDYKLEIDVAPFYGVYIPTVYLMLGCNSVINVINKQKSKYFFQNVDNLLFKKLNKISTPGDHTLIQISWKSSALESQLLIELALKNNWKIGLITQENGDITNVTLCLYGEQRKSSLPHQLIIDTLYKEIFKKDISTISTHKLLNKNDIQKNGYSILSPKEFLELDLSIQSWIRKQIRSLSMKTFAYPIEFNLPAIRVEKTIDDPQLNFCLIINKNSDLVSMVFSHKNEKNNSYFLEYLASKEQLRGGGSFVLGELVNNLKKINYEYKIYSLFQLPFDLYQMIIKLNEPYLEEEKRQEIREKLLKRHGFASAVLTGFVPFSQNLVDQYAEETNGFLASSGRRKSDDKLVGCYNNPCIYMQYINESS